MSSKAKQTHDEMSERPRYKITGPNHYPIMQIPHPPGTEFFHDGWLQNRGYGVEPLNEPARRIFDYQQRVGITGWLPRTPRNSDFGRIFLPDPAVHDPSSNFVRVVSDNEALPNMPRYQAQAAIDESQLPRGMRFPHRKIAAGEVVAIIGWPDGLWDFAPANAEERAVVSYYDENKDHPRLPSSPWCAFHRKIFLPKLPVQIRQRPAAA